MISTTETAPGDGASRCAGSAPLTNAIGLHARPSVKLTQLAKRFQATVEFGLTPDGPWLDAKSPVQVMRAKAPKGATLHFRAHGADAVSAVAALVALVQREFDDGTGDPAPAPAAASRD